MVYNTLVQPATSTALIIQLAANYVTNYAASPAVGLVST
jgi:hypothetical protein